MTDLAPAPDRLEGQIARFADLIGTMKPSAAQRRDGHISTLSIGDIFDGISMGQLASLGRIPDHPMMQMIEVECHGAPAPGGGRTPCPTGARFQCRVYFSEVTACDDCVARYNEADAMGRVKKHWEKICPKGFRDTDKAHAGFPKVQLDELKDWVGTKSLFFYGPTGKGKTRLALLMLKRAMMKNHWVGVLWPDKLRSLVQGYDSTTFDHYAAFDVLLMDDPLITGGRESKLVDAIKNLLDVRMRENKATIITSQIGTEDELAGAKEFGDAKTADMERIKAVVRRLRESCQVVSFGQAVAGQAEGEF